MAPRISLALAIHNHQPVGNFGWVFAEVFEQAYEPLVAALERHPGVRLSLHYTGALLEWLRAERPEFVARLQALIAEGQVELLGGGLYEPVLASLPERDRLAQLVRMSDELEALTGRRPRGAWLAERVWEPDLPTSLAAAGYEWTILDDAHFRAAAIPEDRLWGAYTTEDQGRLLTVFGTEQGLRYRIPFGEVDDVVEYLRRHATDAGERVGMMGDDGEKFGAWPTTWEHCWGGGRWVDRFFDALEANAAWLATVTPSAWLERQPPIGRVYVPTGSYAEMGEWALPADEALVFHGVRDRAIREGRPEARWLRGGFWRNFQVKYREINDLHKQMLRVSAKVDAMPAGSTRERAMDHLHRGQSNDCYWHGLFGGIYISHMRLATYEHLIAAEDLADAVAGVGDVARLEDTDLDGLDDVLLLHPGQVVTVDLADGGGIGSWDVRAVRHALTAVMRRRPEPYHEQLRRHEAERAALASGSGAPGPVASIHEVVRTKEEGLAGRLHMDSHERRSGLIRFLAAGDTPEAWAEGRADELGDAVDGSWIVVALEPGRAVLEHDGAIRAGGRMLPVKVRKTITLGGDRRAPTLDLDVEVENRADATVRCRLGVEWATTMLGGGGNPSAWWEAAGRRTGHDAAGTARSVERIVQGNDHVAVSVETTMRPHADAWWAPIDTISNSEAGFERIYQGSGLLVSWLVSVKPGETLAVAVSHAITTGRDHAEDEADPAATPA